MKDIIFYEFIAVLENIRVKVIVKEPFHETRTPAKLSRETGAAVITLFENPGAAKGVEDYFQMMRYLRIANIKLGLNVNFRNTFLKPKRVLYSQYYS